MALMNFTCADSPVWNGNGFSECFSDLVFGFGGNTMTLLIITVVGILRRNVGERRKECLTGKIVMCLVPALGACMSLFDVVLIVKNAWSKDTILHHRLMFSCSRFSVWATTMLLSVCDCWFFLMCNHIVCCWWIVKPLLSLPHLQITLSSSQALLSLEECSIVLLDFMFGASMNIIRLKHATSTNRLLSQEEDPLLPYDLDFEEAHLDLGFQRFWNTLSFSSIKLVLDRGVMKQLEFDDLLPLPLGMDPSSCHDKLLSSLLAQQINPDSRPSIFKAICFAYGWPYFQLGLLKVLNDCIGFAGPLLLNKLIQFLQQGHRSLDGFALAISLGVASLLKSFLDTQYTYRLAKLKLKLRSSIMTIIYEKCLHVNVAERSEFSDGEIQTFMSVDADRIVNLCNSFHDMWSLPLQIGVALYLLYTQVKFAFLSGVAITILLIPVNKWISKMIASATEKMMKQKDERIRRTAELLTQIRSLKLYGWEKLFAGWVMKTRSAEVTHLTTRKYLDAWCVFFWATTPTLFSLTTFGLFAITGNQLDAATAFTCVALFNTLISPLNSFPWVINGLIDAIISTSRLSRLFACSVEKSNSGAMNSSSEPSGLAMWSEYSDLNDNAVFMRRACFSWSSNIHADHGFKLGPVDLNLRKGSLIAIVGEVGSGKSSLLNAILGEMQIKEGWVHATGSMAYVPQVPWVLAGTIRDNILFGKEYNPKRYAEVIEACRLGFDFSQMSSGDMAYVGEKGANLSGGQRARLALARAIYNDADIFLLDDVLSAVDAQVGQCILHNAICGPLVEHRTRLLCTHNYGAIASADIVVLLDKGCIKFVGSPADLTFSQYSAHTLFAVSNSSQSVQSQKHNNCSAPAIVEENLQEKRDSISICSGVEEIIDTEERKEGKVELVVYRNYAAFSGWFVAALIFVSAFLMQITRNGNDLWLSFWVDTTSGSDGGGYSLSFYVGVLGGFCIINSILTLARAFSFAFGGIRAAIRVHDMLLNTLVHVPLHFYDRTPCGRILNRLSSDLYTIDDSLPFILNILLANFVGLLGIAVVLTYVQVMFLLLLLPLWFMYRKLQLYYRSTSRELRRLDSVSRSPIYMSFTETLDGSSTIRAFRSEDVFLERFINFVAIYQRTSYSELVASLWLSLRLQLVAACVISFIAILAVFGSHRDLPLSLDTPGLVGLALSYAAPVVSLLGSFLTSFTETEKEMVAIERVLQYMDTPQEQCDGSQPLSSDWPFKGQIEFCSVTMRYLPSLPAALLDVTFTIAGGTQVGIVGRTGAGKSSILNALFRLVPLSGGQIIVDGVNIGYTPVCELRSRLAVVPQSPFLFQGSLRDNLDPYRICDDGKLWKALEKCHMKEEVQAAGGLELCVNESGASFSVGQRQLLCLARAFLKSSKVLCLDECTANVDAQTASILHKVISWECQGMTVITIAHRISSVLNMDKILVLEQGTLVEQGEPKLLLLNEQSRFSSFARASSM